MIVTSTLHQDDFGTATFRSLLQGHVNAMSFPSGRHFFVEAGVLKLTVAKTPMEGGGEAVLEHPVRFCPFCGTPISAH